MDRARIGWAVLALVAGAIAAFAVGRWVWAVTLNVPVLYSEGAVAHAALLARYGLEYTTGAAVLEGPVRPIFTAANYPPLYFKIAALADPLVFGRLVSIVATLFVAGAIAWRARGAGGLTALAVALAWVATFPVTVWGAAVKPDLVALALSVAGVIALSDRQRRPIASGVLLALAIWTKPTAVLPAVALAAWCLRQDRGTFWRYALALVVSLAALAVVLVGPSFPLDLYKCGPGFCLHVLTWNALQWNADQVALLMVVAAATFGVAAVIVTFARAWNGPTAAYAVSAVLIVALGGREGATVNYLLDLSAATALAGADLFTRRRIGVHPARALIAPAAVAAQLIVAFAVFDPFGVLGRTGTGAWGDPSRVEVIRALPPGPALVEDSGLLLAVGREPVVDDLFLWSRLRALYSDPARFIEGDRLIAAVEERRFTAIVSEADLERIDQAPAYERARWHPDLVRAVLNGYTLDRKAGALWVYRPR